MRCLLTGSSGHLGSYLTRLLLARGHEVMALTRPQSVLWRLDGTVQGVELDASVLHRVRFVCAAPAQWASCADEVRSFAPHVAFHLGWAGVTADARNENLQMTENIAQSLAFFRLANAAGCRTLVGIGSQAEYGPQNRALTEDMPAQPATAYGAAKLSTGKMLEALAATANVRFVWLRLLATYGPKDDLRHLVPSVTLQLLAKKKPSLTAGEQLWDYLYVEDADEAVLSAAECPTAQGVYNLGSGEAVAVRCIVERIRDLIDPVLPLGLGELPYRNDQLMLLKADITKLRTTTGWTPKTSLEQGLAQTVAWYRRTGGRFG